VFGQRLLFQVRLTVGTCLHYEDADCLYRLRSNTITRFVRILFLAFFAGQAVTEFSYGVGVAPLYEPPSDSDRLGCYRTY